MLSWLLVLVLERMMYLLSENIYTTISGGDTVLTLAPGSRALHHQPHPGRSTPGNLGFLQGFIII